MGKTEYAGPKQPWWKHLWNGAKGTVIGGTQSERVELLETQAQASELASRVALTELRKFYNKNPQPGMTFEQWKAQVLRPEINELVRTKLGLEIKKDQPEPTSDLEDY